METFRFWITPLNENQELNYCELFDGPINELQRRCNLLQQSLKKLLKQGQWTIRVTDEKYERAWTFDDGMFMDKDGNLIGQLKMENVLIMERRTTEYYITAIAAKIFNDGLDASNYDHAKAEAILNQTVNPRFCKKILNENESAVIATMKTFRRTE